MKKNKIFLFFGPPGSGKGTLSEMCVDEFGWLQLSTGNLCRQHIALSTEIGKKIQELTAQGLLVPDEVIARMVAHWITSQTTKSEGIVFDGYPRTLQQAEMFYNFWQEKLFDFELIVVKFNIDAQLLIDRILNRVVCSNKDCGRVYSLLQGSENRSEKDMICDVCSSVLVRRNDDTEQSFALRLKIYYQHEQEIIDFFVGKGFKIHVLNAIQNAQKLFEDFKKIVLLNYGS